MVQLNYVDAEGDGIAQAAPYPNGLDKTVYNGSKPCGGCGVYLNPVQSLNSDLCPSCSRRKASNQLANRMA